MAQVSVIGNTNADIVARPVSSLPAPGTEQVIDSIEFRVGGAGAIAALCLAALRIRADLLGCVGNDPIGRVLLSQLVQAGVAVNGVAVRGATGICIATEASTRDRSFLIAPGAVREFSLSQVDDRTLGSRWLLVCGYFLVPALRRGGAASILRQVRERGGETLLDTGWDPDGWPAAAREEVLELLPWVSVFAPNEAEAVAITNERSALGAARALQERSGGWCVVKLGAQGSVAAGPDHAELCVPAPQVNVVDTTGAGDAFNAGLIRARLDDLPWQEAVQFATRLASTVVSRPSHDRYPRPDDLSTAAGPRGSRNAAREPRRNTSPDLPG
jgi:sugar/nucleoside kinase (ribokinase family)